MKVVFAVTETGINAAAGDFFTALELGEALKRCFGWEVEFRSRGEGWYALGGVDLLIAMLDDYDPLLIRDASPLLIKLAWARNWFDRWALNSSAGKFDLFFASSRPAASYLRERLGRLVEIFRIATNPDRFKLENRLLESNFDYVFTGSYWQAKRDIVEALSGLPSHLSGAVFGRNWEQVPEFDQLHKGFVSYTQIHKIYGATKIVIDDANHATKKWGATNSRVFDALAAGCLVITNSRTVSDDTFGGELPVYETPGHLMTLLSDYLKDGDRRDQLVQRLHGIVLAQHCYSNRAYELGLHLKVFTFGRQRALAPKFGLQLSEIGPHHLGNLTSSESDAGDDRFEPPTKPVLSFIVPLFNHLQQTQEMLGSLQASLPSGLDYEVIFVDDASTDGTIAWLKTLGDARVRWLGNEVNRGYAFSTNRGVGLSVADFICLLNNDLLFEPGWFEPLLEVFHQAPHDVGVVGNLQYRIDDGQLDHAGIRLNADAKFDHVRTLDVAGGSTTQALAVTGACMFLRKEDFVAAGGFDEGFTNGGEDVDLCFKLRSLGKETCLATKSRIRHHVSLSRGNTNIQDERNSRRLFSKWRPQIKAVLASVWHDELSSGSTVFPALLDGQLSAAFLVDCELAADVLAESILSREEAHWVRLLGDIGDASLPPELCVVEGLVPATMLGELKVAGRAVFTFTGVSRASNFYVCGRTTADCSPYPLALRLCVNEVQTTETVLGAGCLVNVGVVNPIILSGKSNRFEVEVVPMNPRAQRFDGISNDVVVSHVVLDDRIYPASGFSQRFTTR